MSLLDFMRSFAESSWSIGLHESRYGYPLVESVHVWALCLFFGLAVIFDLRLLGWTMKTVPVSDLARRLMPWTVAGFVLMVISGSLLFSAIPLRSYQNIFFRTKMATLMLAALNVFVFHNTVDRRRTEWDSDPVPPRSARWGGGVALVLCAVLIVLGRMIPYQVYWFDCNKQPQPAILNWLAGCASASP